MVTFIFPSFGRRVVVQSLILGCSWRGVTGGHFVLRLLRSAVAILNLRLLRANTPSLFSVEMKEQQASKELWEFPTAYCWRPKRVALERCRFYDLPPVRRGIRLGGCYYSTPGFQPPILHLAKLIWHLCETTTTTTRSTCDPGYESKFVDRF